MPDTVNVKRSFNCLQFWLAIKHVAWLRPSLWTHAGSEELPPSTQLRSDFCPLKLSLFTDWHSQPLTFYGLMAEVQKSPQRDEDAGSSLITEPQIFTNFFDELS